MVKTLFFTLWFLFHPVHVTITSIDYVQEECYFKVFIRMYFDDFLLDSKLKEFEIDNKNNFVDNETSLQQMQNYLGEKVMITANEKHLTGILEEMQLADNEISMNLKYAYAIMPETITIRNLLLTNLYSDQVNMIIVRIKDFEEGVKLTSDLTEQTFEIK
jgi:hypothetical protein